MKRSAAKRNRWEDHYSRKARKERFPARSVYKLKEIQQKYRLIRRGDRVLDLGCSPGSWLVYAAELTGKAGEVIGVDLKPVSVALPSQARTHQLDILAQEEASLEALGGEFSVVLSDMAPSTTGSKAVDGARSYALCEAALSVASAKLKPGGSFVCKILQGEDFKTFLDSVRERFNGCRIFKPQSSRKASKEIYVIGLGKS